MISRYKQINDEIDNLNLRIRDKLIAIVFSFIFGFLIISGPLAITINLFVFIDLIRLLVFIIGLLIILLFYITCRVYLKIITKNQIKGLNVIYVTDTFIFSIFVFGLFLLLILIGVI